MMSPLSGFIFLLQVGHLSGMPLDFLLTDGIAGSDTGVGAGAAGASLFTLTIRDMSSQQFVITLY
jgi:hypothetical protein